jgi:ketosteroid isomerase-like protein
VAPIGWRTLAACGSARDSAQIERPRPTLEERTMGEHPNAAVVRRMNEAMMSGDTATAASLVADDVVWHAIGAPEPVRGKAALAASMAGFTEANITYDVHDVLASDDHVIALGTASATIGDRSLTYRTAEIYHVGNGQVTERWAFSDDTKAITDFFG